MYYFSVREISNILLFSVLKFVSFEQYMYQPLNIHFIHILSGWDFRLIRLIFKFFYIQFNFTANRVH